MNCEYCGSPIPPNTVSCPACGARCEAQSTPVSTAVAPETILSLNDLSHEEIIRQLALDAAKEVRRWGETVTLQPMNAHDRRIVYITLENESDIQCKSSGSGDLKNVVVFLKKSENSSQKSGCLIMFAPLAAAAIWFLI